MSYKIRLKSNFSGEHLGQIFVRGETSTEDKFLATRLKSRGYDVAAETVVTVGNAPGEAAIPEEKNGENPEETETVSTVSTLEKLTVPQLKNYAEEHNIELGAAKTKAEIISAISAAEAEETV